MQRTTFIVLVNAFSLYWWLFLIYSRHKTAQAKAAARAKHLAAWDAAYNKALKDGKGEYYAMMEAAKAINANKAILKLWDSVYDKAVNAGASTYKAGTKATAAVRQEAVR